MPREKTNEPMVSADMWQMFTAAGSDDFEFSIRCLPSLRQESHTHTHTQYTVSRLAACSACLFAALSLGLFGRQLVSWSVGLPVPQSAKLPVHS